LTWSAPGQFAYATGLPVLSGADIPLSGDGVNNQLYVQTGSTPQTIWFKESGTWTRLTGSTLYVDLVNNQTIAGTKTFSSQIQGSVSGTSSNVTSTVAIANGGTGQITSTGALNALLPTQTGNTGKYLTTDGSNASWAPTTGAGTVTSVNVSGGTTGLTTSGGPITAAGTITLAGTLAVANGGTGSTSTTYANLASNVYGVLPVNNGGTGVITSTGSGNNVLSTNASLTTPTQVTYENWTGISAPTYTEGRMWYDSAAHALAYYNDSSTSTVHIGQDLQVKVINNTGSTIANGSPVYITGTSSGQTYPNIALAKADVAGTSSVIGLTNGAITNGSIGYVTSQGGIDGVNTGSFTVGQVLYLSPYSAGQLMNTIPPTGITVQVGVVSYVDSSAGKIYVKQTTPLAVPASIITGQVAIANGGTGQSTQAAAITALTGTQTSGYYLRSNGTNSVLSAIQAADVPTLNQNTTGTAANITATSNSTLTTLSALSLPTSQLTGTLGIGNGGTGQTTANAAFNALVPSQTSNSGKFLTTDGTNTSWATNPLGTVTSVAATVPSFLSITGSPITTSGTLAISLSGTALPTTSGGTGLTSFTANGVVYASSTSALTTGSALTFDGSKLVNTGYNKSSYQVSTGSVGTFESVGGAYLSYASGANLYSMLNGSGTEDILNLRASAHLFYINSVEQMRLNNSGNLTLGVALSSWGTPYKVIQLGDSTSSGAIYQSISGGTLSIASNEYISATGPRYTNTAPANRYLLGNGSHSWYTAASGTAGTAISYTQAMTLDSSGNLFVNSLNASKVVFTDASKNLTSTGTVAVAQGGTGTTTPALVAGTNVTITGTWPNQTINSSNTGGTVTSVSGTGTVNGLTLTGTVTTSGNLTLGGTLSGIANSALTNSSITIGGTTIALGGSSNALANDITVYGITVGRGAGAVSTNTAVGASALSSGSQSGGNNTAIGHTALLSNTTGNLNTAVGRQALYSTTTGVSNTGLGMNALVDNTTGSYNTSIGNGALQSNTTASNNTAVGYQAGYANTTGTQNTSVGALSFITNTTGIKNSAFGYGALYSSTGSSNTAIGNAALTFNSTGNYNTAVGDTALVSNTTASNNTAVGYRAAYANTTGAGITAIGSDVLAANTTGVSNVGVGGTWAANLAGALNSNTTGSYNTAMGVGALAQSTTASYNTVVGYQAGYNTITGAQNTFIGRIAGRDTTGSLNTFVGDASGVVVTTGSKNTIIGSYSGNGGGLDIRTSNNYIVLSDGDGNPRMYCNVSGDWVTQNGLVTNNLFGSGGTSNTGGASNWWKIGTVNRYTDSLACEIVLQGTRAYGAGEPVAGQTVIMLRANNGGTLEGFFYGVSQGNQTVTAVAYLYTGTGALFDIYVKPAANFASFKANVRGEMPFTPQDYNTGSTTQPASSTSLQSIWNLQIAGTNVLTANSYGLGLGDTTPSSGMGLTFPATQSASSNANTLDDYEEGNWTPSLTFTGASTGMTYSVRTGSYTKIGRLVYFNCRITLTNKGSSTGYAQILGLPFAVSSDAGTNYSGAYLCYSSSTSGWNQTLQLTLDQGQSYIFFRYTNGSSNVEFTETNFTNSTDAILTGCYQVNT
jgi:hypothetical protein